MSRGTQIISVRIDAATHDLIRQLMARSRLTRSEVIREAIRALARAWRTEESLV